MSGNDPGGSERVPPLNLTRSEISILHGVLSSYNVGGAFGVGTGDFEDYESLRLKVERIHRSLDTGSDTSGGEP